MTFKSKIACLIGLVSSLIAAVFCTALAANGHTAGIAGAGLCLASAHILMAKGGFDA